MYEEQRLRSIWRNPIHFLACACGVGTMPLMPGTYATAATIPLYFMLMKLPLAGYIVITLILIIFAGWATHITNRDFATHDHPATASDEVIGFLVTMIALPATWYYILLGFILFRLFDIWKPGPIGWIDRHVHGGFGVVLDDVVAAVVANIILQVVRVLGWAPG